MIVAAAFAALWSATEGFRVLTSESARRLEVARDPLPLPGARLADGRELRAALRDDGRVVLVDFIYTQCESLCTALGTDYQQLQREILRRGLGGRVRLLSLSFDPGRDSPQVLARHQARLGADPTLWQASTVPDPAQRARLLAAFGIVVVPDGRGDFVHNAAIHVVDAQGRLRGIHDLGRWQSALADALEAR
ncbi:SCO family protein [Arenimonas sp.]|uniref:SCO family protein n=1 Tax=Arenimonas sp. TaxID=1872635 RepID=UPI0035ADF213